MLASDALPLERPASDLSREMPDMMLSLGIEPALLRLDHPALYAGMESVCAGCASKDQCRHDLAAETAAESFTAYCGNAATLSLLAGRPELARD